MTINEAIDIVVDASDKWDVTEKEDEAITTMIEAYLEQKKELRWWRSQDLISRDDAIERIENLKRAEKHIDHVITLHHSYCAIGEMPKAEYTTTKTEGHADESGLASAT